MSRGVADNRDSDDANLPSNSSLTASQSPTDASADPPSSSAPTADNHDTLVQQNAQTPVIATNVVNGNAGDTDSQRQQSIELRERSPSPQLEEMPNYVSEEMEFMMNGSDDRASGQGSTGSQESIEVFDPDLRRVKLYELVGSRWTDRGTAFCCGEFDSELDEARLIIKAEGTQQEILSCRVRAQDVYQRQQQTLIVWTEPDGADYALSFQDQEGCAEVWEFITEVQKHLNSRVPSTAAQIISSGHLPPPGGDATFIGEIEKAIRTMARSPKSRETICFYIQENKYVYQLVAAFDAAEKAENLDALHALCSCMQTILLLNEHSMYEHILLDDLWMGVVGMLEYDPEFPKFKANYREFLQQRSQFMQPIVIKNEEIQRKIHATYRLQYLKDVILGRALDDSTFSVLNSCIIFNQIDIINHIQRDEHFLAELVSYFIRPAGAKGKEKEKEKGGDMAVDKPSGSSPTVNGAVSSSPGPLSSQTNHVDDNADVERKKEIIALLQQLCVMGKNVQLPARIALFRTLVERGVLYAVQWALCRPEKHMVSTAGEILSVLLDHHSQSVRNHVLTQAVALGQPTNATDAGISQEHAKIPDVTNGGPPPFKETLAQVLGRMMANSQDLAVQTQIADALRLLVDTPPEPPVPPPPETPQIQGQPGSGPVPNAYLNRPIRDEVNTERFLDNFYKVCIETLMRPLTHDVPDHHELKNTPFTPSRERGNVYLYLCDLLCSFAIQHSFRSYFFVITSNVVSRVASLLSVKDKHLCLAALRFFRICLKMNNRNLFLHMQKHEVFTPICKLTIREARRENLLSSTCQEFFEFMRKENLRDPIAYIMDKHEAEIRELAKTAKGFATFQNFISRWEINKEPPPPEIEKRPSIIVPPRIFGQRVMESEEDDSYFNSDESEDDPVVPVPRVDSFLGLFRRKRQRISAPGPHAQVNKTQRLMSVPSQNRPVSPLSSLLEYDDDDDATSPLSEQIRSEKDPSTPQSPVLPHRQIQILPYDPSQDEPSDPEDELLESLVSKRSDGQASPPPKSLPAKLAEKRRRGDDEDDAFERLAPKNRRLSNASEEASKAAAARARAAATEEANAGKTSDENQGQSPAPRKLRVKITVSKNSGQQKPTATSPASSKSDSKDDGNG
ncbi:PSY2 [Sanghuangporus vaninii]